MKIADDFELHPRVLDDLERVHGKLRANGELPSPERLDHYYRTFRGRFGPDALLDHDGEALLSLMHESTRDGMIYWLEFKDDDEFPSLFGSVAGGSALKYGFYRRQETGEWTTGLPRAQRTITTGEAVELAHRNRDQLVAASKLLDGFPSGAPNEAYMELQRRLASVAPDVQDSVWGHKYLTLIHPDKLDDFHVVLHQRFHLAKLLQVPSPEKGRYVNASRFVSLSRALQWPLNHVTTVLNRRNGPPHRYWMIDARAGLVQTNRWDRMRRESTVAVGWPQLGDLSEMLAADNFREILKARLAKLYPAEPSATSPSAPQLTNFCKRMADGDIVLACDGAIVLGVGRVNGEYQYSPGEEFPHERPVRWLDLGKWRLPTAEGLRRAVHEYRNHFDNWVAIERRVLEPTLPIPGEAPEKPKVPVAGPPKPARWVDGGMIGRIQDLLDRKGQAILYGPPGTGKTYWAELAVRNVAALWNYRVKSDDLSKEEQDRVMGQRPDAYVRTCTFHPGYGYEDFIEGFRPTSAGGNLSFAIQEGIFKTLCEAASEDPGGRYYLIIDEINRGDIPRIFGELLTLLDKPKRGSAVLLPLSGDPFAVPENVFVVGTMNTADRSIALLDTALRRRFGFIELMPDPGTLGDTVIEGIAGRPIQEFRHLARILQEDVLPLLEEYCYEDWEALERILGSGLVDIGKHRFKAQLFEPGRQSELVRAILAVTPDVSASAAAVEAEASSEADAAEGDDEGEDEET